MFTNDEALFNFLKEKLYTAAICDALDTLGYRNQSMHPRLRPLLPDIHACGFAGRARTIQWQLTDQINEADPYGLELEAMDSLRPGDVVVHSTDLTANCAPWGELMSTVAIYNGAAGCICDSNIRDALKIIEMGFPVYYTGIRPIDSKGRGIVQAMDVPIGCGDVSVRPGELVFADFDGIVVIPKEVELDAVVAAAEKAEKESRARLDLRSGKTLRSTFQTHGVL